MIQIQNGRFHHNWEKQSNDHKYRRYKNIRPAFVERWEHFKGFVRNQSLGELRPTQYELSYVNHVAAGELWDVTRGFTEVIPGLLRLERRTAACSSHSSRCTH